MSRQSKGPRLYLRRGRIDNRSGARLPDVYFIRDKQGQVSTGCGPDRLPEAERCLSDYIAAKWSAPVPATVSRCDPAQVLIADVLGLYAEQRAPKLARDPATTAGFIEHLLAWWDDKTLAEVKRSTCQAYAAFRQTQPVRSYKNAAAAPRVTQETARIELECLSAAIGYWNGEDQFTTRPKVWLPEKRESRRDALTRSQAAGLLWAAMGWRRGADGRWTRLGPSIRANRAHLRRFILMGLYTGSRHSVLTGLLWSESATHPWADLDKGMIYRRGRDVREHRTKRRPVVKMPRRLLAHMKRWRAADEKASTDERPIISVLHHGGEPLRGRIRTGFEGIVRDSRLSGEVTPHWMRHTCATWLMERDLPPWEAAAFAGMSVAVLEKHYAHHRPDYQADAAKAAGATRRVQSGK